MKKRYRKIATIEAEQWDGMPHLDVCRMLHAEGPILPHIHTKEGHIIILPGNWIATGVDGEKWPIDDAIFRKSYVEDE